MQHKLKKVPVNQALLRADKGSRTPLFGLGSQRSTDEPYLHIISIARIIQKSRKIYKNLLADFRTKIRQKDPVIQRKTAA